MGAPDKIYLQIGDDANEEEIPDDDWYISEITWCVDKINDNDIEYIKRKNMKEYIDCEDLKEALKEAIDFLGKLE